MRSGLQQNLPALWRGTLLSAFAAINFYFVLNQSNWTYGLLGVLCVSSVWLLLLHSPHARYPLYIATLLMMGSVLQGVYNYTQRPDLRDEPVSRQIIGWLIPLVPLALLINCSLYARRIAKSVKTRAD